MYIIDWLMPDMNGIETVRRIRMVVGEEYPIIILTAYDWSDVEQEAREAGVTAFVSKPLFLSELREVLMSQAHRELLKNEKQKAQAENRKSYAGKKVLLVEDNELNAEIATVQLEEFGIKVERAVDGRNAVEIFRNHPEGTFDVILMDIMMPEMNGYEAAKAIRAMNDRPDGKNIPIIAMTANSFAEDVQASLDAGMNAHLSKPIVIEEVIKTILRYVHND